MRIRSVAPHVLIDDERQEHSAKRKCATEGTELEFSYLPTGPGLVESEAQASEALKPLVAEVLRAEMECVDAVVIDCFLDPGLEVCRDSVRIPVVGPGLASLTAAMQHGRRIGVLNPNELGTEMVWSNLRRYGLEGHVAFVEGLLPDEQRIQSNHRDAVEALREKFRLVAREGMCDVLVLGCTAFEALREGLPSGSERQVPVIFPYRWALWAAESLVRNRLLEHPRNTLG